MKEVIIKFKYDEDDEGMKIVICSIFSAFARMTKELSGFEEKMKMFDLVINDLVA